MNIQRALQEEGIPSYWATEPELMAHCAAVEEEVLREQAALEDAIAKNSAANPDLFGGGTKQYSWAPKAVPRALLKRPKEKPEDQLALLMGEPKRRYTKESDRNFQDFRGHELSCLLGLLESAGDDFVNAVPGSTAFYDAWLWVRIPEPSWKAFSFACCCQARGDDSETVRADLERLLRARLSESEWKRHFRLVLTLAIAEAELHAKALGTWHEIAEMRDELAALEN